MKAILSPSLLSADLANAAAEARSLAKAGISWLHIDVMDGSFVPNITFGPPFIASLRKNCPLFFDVHLMLEDPGRHIRAFADAGADLLVPHLEAMRHPQRVLAQIAELGLKAGIALNPDTDPSRLRWLLPYLDMILIMGVNPGFSGQKFLPETVSKITACREFLVEHGYGHLPIEVDGGASPDNAAELVEAGASILVSGSAFFRHADYRQAADKFAKAAENAVLDDSLREAAASAASWRGRQNQ